MGVIQTTQYSGVTSLIVNIAATTDPDTAAAIPHGMGALSGFLASRVQVRLTNLPGGKPSNNSANWALSTVDNTNVHLDKDSATGSSTTAPQLQVIIDMPHSIRR